MGFDAAQRQRKICGKIRYSCLRELAYVDPFKGVGVFEQLIKIELDSAARASDGGKDGSKSFQAFVEVNVNALVDPKGAHAAHRMAYKLKDLVGGEHFRLHMELILEFAIIDSCISRGKDEYAAIVLLE